MRALREEIIANSKNLYVFFGGIANGIEIPSFEFCRSSNILNDSRVFVRDFDQSWYQNGLRGVSSDVAETSVYLKDLKARVSPVKTIFVGNSMGGYAAILFSMLVGETRAIAFSPQTFIGPIRRVWERDWRWGPQLRRMYMRNIFRLPMMPLDLAKICPAPGVQVEIHVSNRCKADLRHAFNMAALPFVAIHRHDFGDHKLVSELRDRDLLKQILRT